MNRRELLFTVAAAALPVSLIDQRDVIAPAVEVKRREITLTEVTAGWGRGADWRTGVGTISVVGYPTLTFPLDNGVLTKREGDSMVIDYDRLCDLLDEVERKARREQLI